MTSDPTSGGPPNRRGKPPAMLRCDRLIELTIADAPSAWSAAGFTVHNHPMAHRHPFVKVGHVVINLIGGRGGIVSWGFDSSPAHNAEMGFVVDGLATTLVSARDEERHDILNPFLEKLEREGKTGHANGVVGIDHVVVFTTNASRTIGMMAMLGIHPKRPADDRNGSKFWFFKSGDVVIELVQVGEATRIENQDGASFWGITFLCHDLDKVVKTGLLKNKPKRAVQGGGRTICTLDHVKAGISTNVAFITPRAPNPKL
ncbi:hypothetical protein BC830DRAFT_1108589 [Chytriomyces sp. MP71]|nr:hypothetical protein BC830DRAFT_1108589 [Chytriomyces sp. MP71]